MCGIVGFLDKTAQPDFPLGKTILAMLRALACRGPDSTGVALFREWGDFWIVRIKIPDNRNREESRTTLVESLERCANVPANYVVSIGAFCAAPVSNLVNPRQLEDDLIANCQGIEIVSLGRSLEIWKQVGSPDQLDRDFNIGRDVGTHGIGHTRLSTESRVDLSHSQPFWAHGVPDLATVHNGHITNYHKLRRMYEQRGCRFYTENDSEVIGVYLRDRMDRGLSFADALRSSLDDFDGSFSYLAATDKHIAYVRDRFGFKPLIVAETESFVAIATEEIALRSALGSGFSAREPDPGTMAVWSVGSRCEIAASR